MYELSNHQDTGLYKKAKVCKFAEYLWRPYIVTDCKIKNPKPDENFTFKTSVVILSGANVGRTAYTEIIVASSGIAGHAAFTIVFAHITNHCQQNGNWLSDIPTF